MPAARHWSRHRRWGILTWKGKAGVGAPAKKAGIHQGDRPRAAPALLSQACCPSAKQNCISYASAGTTKLANCIQQAARQEGRSEARTAVGTGAHYAMHQLLTLQAGQSWEANMHSASAAHCEEWPMGPSGSLACHLGSRPSAHVPAAGGLDPSSCGAACGHVSMQAPLPTAFPPGST